MKNRMQQEIIINNTEAVKTVDLTGPEEIVVLKLDNEDQKP